MTCPTCHADDGHRCLALWPDDTPKPEPPTNLCTCNLTPTQGHTCDPGF